MSILFHSILFYSIILYSILFHLKELNVSQFLRENPPLSNKKQTSRFPLYFLPRMGSKLCWKSNKLQKFLRSEERGKGRMAILGCRLYKRKWVRCVSRRVVCRTHTHTIPIFYLARECRFWDRMPCQPEVSRSPHVFIILFDRSIFKSCVIKVLINQIFFSLTWSFL